VEVGEGEVPGDLGRVKRRMREEEDKVGEVRGRKGQV